MGLGAGLWGWIYRLPLKLVGEGFVVMGGEGLDGLLLGTRGEQWLVGGKTGCCHPGKGPWHPGWAPQHAPAPLHPHLIPPKFEGDGDVYGVIDDAHHRAHQ